MNCRQNPVESGGRLCGRCWEQIISLCTPDYCRRCGRDASPYAIADGVCAGCRNEDILFDAIARAGVYAEALKEAILAFKHGQTELDLVLAGLIDSALRAGPFLAEVELFVPVPLHWLRRLYRGYNHSLVLAKRLKHPSAKISTDLVRIRYTKPQPGMLTPAARVRNVKDAFAVRYRHPFEGRKVCLVDDVKTTGATLNECAKTLKEAGASKVFALVLAIAGQNKA
ncbi:MAG: ComF family protein [Sedimentisphaerales bacterium]|nr:ComF family protein [Sedimentisphaerales bacterium]